MEQQTLLYVLFVEDKFKLTQRFIPTLKVKTSYTFTYGKIVITALSQSYLEIVLCILLISEGMMYLDDVKSSKHTLTSLLFTKRLE